MLAVKDYLKNFFQNGFSAIFIRLLCFFLLFIPNIAAASQIFDSKAKKIIILHSCVSAFLVILIAILIRNILCRKRAEQALWVSEKQALKRLAELENIYLNTPVGLGLVDTELRYVRINDFLATIHGKSIEEHIGRTIAEVVPEINRVVEPLYRKVIDSGIPLLNHEMSGKTAADPEKPHFWLTNYFPLKSSEGTVLGVTTVVSDISARKQIENDLKKYQINLEETVKKRMAEVTEANCQLQLEIQERKSAEAALQESEKLYRTLIEKANDAVFLLEAEGSDAGKIISANQAAAEMHGYSFDELLALNIKDLDTTETAKAAPERLKRIFAGEWIAEEITHKKKDGSTFPVEISAGLLEFGNRTYILAFDRDITDRKKVENDLIQSQKSEAIGTLAGGIAHDFNNILGTIIGYSEMIEMFDMKEDSPARNKLLEVIRAAYRAKKLVEQILTFSRRVKQEKRPIQLDPLIKEVLGFIKALLPPNITIQYTVNSKSTFIMADATQVHQILMNLCTNAMHAMRRTGGVIAITLDKQDVEGIASMMLGLASGKYVKLTVSDTGEGMNQEVMERVFDPYFTTKETGEGTGMGLAVVQGIVKNYDGTVTVESGEGIGSVFQVFFPMIAKSNFQEEETPSLKISKGKGKILFVDDEPSLVILSKDVLEQCGYSVVTTTSSLQALEMFRAESDQFDLVITDQVMPKLKGNELAEKILEIRPDIPVVLCTGYSGSITDDVAKKIGVREFLFKPVGAVNLMEVVSRVIDNR
jgi:PAS domain S-box-containing protein